MANVMKPSVGLRPFIRFYAHTDGHHLNAAFVQPVPARTAPVLEFSFGDRYTVTFPGSSRSEISDPITIVGAQTHRRLFLTMRGRVISFVIVFQPGGLQALFSVTPGLLTDRHFEGRSVLGADVDQLWAQLAPCPSFIERARVADTYLLKRYALGIKQDAAVVPAANALFNRCGGGRVSVMAEQAGLSVRQFERRFNTLMGMPPKTYARIARFEVALRAKLQSPASRWTDIAHLLGYHDQMHMVHDFRELAGSTPTHVAPQLTMFVQDELDATR
ncbi:MAG: helix-turn-helix domain-containing protein [Vicinamibacterales bacterium]